MDYMGKVGMLIVLMTCSMAAARARTQTESSGAEIDAFNQKYIAAHKNMDNAMVSSLWADDGVSLLPEMAPLVGKAAITKFFDEAVKPLAGYHVEKMEIDFREIQVMGDWAYEWGLEHQVLEAPVCGLSVAEGG
jgi:ketosteroid isomerase-like protein